jgi:hypothetical protein
MRELVEDNSSAKKWLMFDGPVDAIWIENMVSNFEPPHLPCVANIKPVILKSCGRGGTMGNQVAWLQLLQKVQSNFKLRQEPRRKDTLIILGAHFMSDYLPSPYRVGAQKGY